MIEKEGAEIDEIWFCCQRDLHSELDKNVPTRKPFKRNKHEPFWFNKHARKLVVKKRKLYNLYKKTESLHSLPRCQEIRKSNKKVFYQIKKTYMQKNLFKPLTEGNNKPFYAHVKNVKGKSNAVTSIQDTEGVLMESPTSIFIVCFQLIAVMMSSLPNPITKKKCY